MATDPRYVLTRCCCIILLVLLLAACGGPAYRVAVHESPETKGLKGHQKPYSVNGEYYKPLLDHRGFVEEGTASWYGPDFHGKPTSCGETYDMYALTAAHKILPLGVHVRVTNQRNGKSVMVRVNDRGPFVKSRIIDLSYAAAKELDVVDSGTAPVRIEALGFRQVDRDGAIAFRQPESYADGRFTVQVGAFADPQNAKRLAAKLQNEYGASSIQQGWVNGVLYHRVRAGLYVSLQLAEDAKNHFASSGYPNSFVVASE